MPAKSFSTLSVRINPEVFDEFTGYIKKHPVFTQAQIVESLIRYFMNQGDEQRYLLAMGVGRDYLGLISEALQLTTWGDHAARGLHWLWVIEIYNELDRVATKAQENAEKEREEGGTTPDNLEGILSIRRMAWFKLGRAWIDVAKGLRSKAVIDLADSFPAPAAKPEAVTSGKQKEKKQRQRNEKPKNWKELYGAALNSLRIAIANFRLFNRSLEQSGKLEHPTVLYNNACAWSLIAQYLTEQNADNDALEPLVRDKQSEDGPGGMGGLTPNACLKPSGAPEVERALQKGWEDLSKITIDYRGDAEGMPFADAQWMFEFADRDPDLACLHEGKKDDFEKWRDKGMPHSSLLKSYERFQSRLSDVIASELTSIERELE
jgi:hypothetical protein